MSATPVINYPNDIAVLINIVKNKDILPTDRSIFNSMYYDEEEIKLTNEKVLLTKLSDAISYYKNRTSSSYPTQQTEYKTVEMNKEQIEEYGRYIKRYLYNETVTINKTTTNLFDIDFATFNRKKRNFFLNATRQLSNSIKGNPMFPKIQELYKTLCSGKFPAVVYSNFLKNGIYCIALLLENDGISYKTITGNTNNNKLNSVVNKYNKGEIKVLLISSAGSESLDLKNTRQVHIMEPHWNEAKITQVIGRAARYKSHTALPKNERNIIIYRWISVFPKPILNKSADQYLVELSKKKEEMFRLYDELIQTASIENMTQPQKGGYINNPYVAYKSIYLNLIRIARS